MPWPFPALPIFLEKKPWERGCICLAFPGNRDSLWTTLFLLGAAVLSITLLLVILPSFVLTMLWCRRSYFKISSIPKPQHEPRKPSKLESCRSGNENEDGYEFVCLVIVRMRNCPWHVSLAVNWRTRFTKVSFVNQKALKSLLRQVCHPYTASLRSQHDFFSHKHVRNQGIEREAGFI